MRNLSAIYSNEQYKSLNATARDVFFLIYNQFTLSKKSVSEGKTSWRDDNGVFCYLGQKEIANILGKTDRTVRRAIEALKKAKLITVIERGAKRKAKLYVHEIVKAVKSAPVEIEDQQVKEAFEETFEDFIASTTCSTLFVFSILFKAVASALLATSPKVSSKGVEWKRARISYITRALNTVIEKSNKTNVVVPVKYTKVIRREMTPAWLKANNESWKKVYKQETKKSSLSDKDLEKIERMKVLQKQLLEQQGNC